MHANTRREKWEKGKPVGSFGGDLTMAPFWNTEDKDGDIEGLEKKRTARRGFVQEREYLAREETKFVKFSH
jgi:hypothetical protein